MLASETNTGLGAFGRDVGRAADREESNVQALEGLWDRHAASFGE